MHGLYKDYYTDGRKKKDDFWEPTRIAIIQTLRQVYGTFILTEVLTYGKEKKIIKQNTSNNKSCWWFKWFVADRLVHDFPLNTHILKFCKIHCLNLAVTMQERVLSYMYNHNYSSTYMSSTICLIIKQQHLKVRIGFMMADVLYLWCEQYLFITISNLRMV